VIRAVPALVALMMFLSCGRNVVDDSPIGGSADATVRFTEEADSLAMRGELCRAADILLRILEEDPDAEKDVLFRLLGLYHAVAREDEFLLLLDSLEASGLGPLDGWRISALDLGGRPAEALPYVSPDMNVLKVLLSPERNSAVDVDASVGGDGPCRAYCLAAVAEPGDLGPDELELMARFEDFFPSVRKRLMEGIRTAGSEAWEVVPEISPGADLDLLLLEKAAASDSGTFRFWKSRLEGPAAQAAVAVTELLERFEDRVQPSWKVVDLLVSSGYADLAERFSGHGDRWHRLGAEMALLLDSGDHSRLSELLAGICGNVPDSVSARAAMFSCRLMHASGAPPGRVYRAWVDFARKYSWHDFARKAAYDAGKYFDCEQEWSEGADAYLLSLSCAGTYDGDQRAYWRGGFCSYMSGGTARADSIWMKGCGKWPTGYWRDEMLFWAARLAGECGLWNRRDSLLDVLCNDHPWEFYGMLAARRRGSGFPPDMESFGVALMQDTVCSTAVELTAAGCGRAALEFLESKARGNPEAAAALSLMGMHGSAIAALRRMDKEMRKEGGMLPDSLLWLYFPSPYRDLADSVTDGLLLDSHVLQGIMREESYFDRMVVSRAGAVGVVQLMPSTAADVARWYGLEPLSREDFFDPYASVPVGALYINRQYVAFGGEPVLFLAAYNAGPGNASRWVEMHGWNPGDPEMYIEQVTYRETRMYVKKVLRSAWIYERL